MRYALPIWLIFAPSLLAQTQRFELGQRMIAFEKAWDAQPDVAARKRAADIARDAVSKFFSLNLTGAGQTLDEARQSLAGVDRPSAEVRFAESLFVHPEKRIFDRRTIEIPFRLEAFYRLRDGKNDVPLPKNLRVRVRIGSFDGPYVAATELPTVVRWSANPKTDIPEGDYPVRLEVVLGDRLVATHRVASISFLADAAERLRAIAEPFDAPRSIEGLTQKSLASLLERLAEKSNEETNYPAKALLEQIEAIRKDPKAIYYGPKRAGQFWLTLPVGESKYAQVRVMVPESLDPAKPVPLLIAMHGAGGSENLFFDGYGDGATAKLARTKGWVMVATRSGFVGAPPVGEILAELRRRYPIDPKRVYVVGHSMGAAMAVSVVAADPKTFAGVAALGGSGRFEPSEGIRDVPFFVGCGSKDFALNGARGLAAALRKAGVRRVELKEYADIEHAIIVREAIGDVVRFFEASGER